MDDARFGYLGNFFVPYGRFDPKARRFEKKSVARIRNDAFRILFPLLLRRGYGLVRNYVNFIRWHRKGS